MYAWCPSNLSTFSEVFETIEDAIENAQTCYDNKTGYYENSQNSPIIIVGNVVSFDLEKFVRNYVNSFKDYLTDSLESFSFGANVEVECFILDKNKEKEFEEKSVKSLLPLIKKYFYYYPEMMTEKSFNYSLTEKKFL